MNIGARYDYNTVTVTVTVTVTAACTVDGNVNPGGWVLMACDASYPAIVTLSAREHRHVFTRTCLENQLHPWLVS